MMEVVEAHLMILADHFGWGPDDIMSLPYDRRFRMILELERRASQQQTSPRMSRRMR